MPPRAPDRELRRIVADLASTTTEDVEAVLDGLEGDQRRQVTELLADYVGGAPPPPIPPPRPRPPRLPGLSPWMARRLRLALKLDDGPAPGWLGPPAAGPVVCMTPTALKALAACATGLAPAEAPPTLTDRLDAVRRRLARRP